MILKVLPPAHAGEVYEWGQVRVPAVGEFIAVMHQRDEHSLPVGTYRVTRVVFSVDGEAFTDATCFVERE